MLLITRGIEATSDTDAFDKFSSLFITHKLIDARFALCCRKGAQRKC